MYNSNMFSENFDFIDNNLFPPELQFCMPPIDSYPDLHMETFSFHDFDTLESAQMFQMFDNAFQSYTKEFLKMCPSNIDPESPCELQTGLEKPKFSYKNRVKIGTLTTEERRLKVLKYLEKRKRRVYTKKISYLCRKKVADQRERFKGRFVSKKSEARQASSESKSEV